MPEAVTRGGKTILTNGDRFFAVDSDKAENYALEKNLRTASPEEVAKRDQQKEHGGIGGQLAAGAEALGAGAFDAVTGLVTIPSALGSAAVGADDPLARVRGRYVIEDLRAILGEAARGAGLTATTGEAQANQYAGEARARAEANPGSAMAGYVGGQIAGGFGLQGGLATLGERVAQTALGKVGARALQYGAEGFVLGGAQVGEDRYLAGKDPGGSAEEILANGGIGALLGGTLGGLTAVPSMLRGRASRVASKDVERLAANALGEAPKPEVTQFLTDVVNEKYSRVASVASGASEDAIAKYGAANLTETAKAGRNLYLKAPQVLEDATTTLTSAVDDLVKKQGRVFDEVSDLGLKRANIAPKLTGDHAVMRGAAVKEAGRLETIAREVAVDAESFGNSALASRVRKYTDDIVRGIRSTDDAAEQFILLDKAKRANQKWAVKLRSSAGRGDDALKAEQSRTLATKLDEMQEGTRQLLMNEAVFGEAGAAQRSVNEAWENYFQTNEKFRGFLTKTGKDYQTGRDIMRADPKRISGYMRSLGKSESSLDTEMFRGHVQALENLTNKIDEAYDVGSRVKEVDGIRGAAKRIGGALEEADRTVGVVNQIDAIVKAETSNGGGSDLIGAILGGAVGGLPGAAVGGAIGRFGGELVSKPGSSLKRLAQLEALSSRTSARMDKGVKGFLEAPKSALRVVGEAVEKGTSGVRRVAAAVDMPVAVAVLGASRAAQRVRYEEIARELVAMTGNPDVMADRIAESTQDLSGVAPNTQRALAMKSAAAVGFLASKLPKRLVTPNSLTPYIDKPTLTDSELAKFSRYWSAVSDPLSVVRELQRGTLMPEHVEALQSVYPQLYAQLRGKVTEKLLDVKAPIPYQKKRRLSLLMGMPETGDASFTAKYQQTYDAAIAAAQQQRAEQKQAQGAPDIAGRYRSRTEDMQQDDGG